MKKRIPLFIGFVIIMTLIYCGTYIYSSKSKANRDRFMETIDVQFCGKVINKQNITRWGREVTLICVKIDTANIDSIKIFNKRFYTFLRIEKGIASIVIPSVDSDLDSVAINMQNNRKEQFFVDGQLLKEYLLSFSYAYLNEQDLESCFE